jgi:cytochrome c-type biogenesis protein CcmH/NrfG
MTPASQRLRLLAVSAVLVVTIVAIYLPVRHADFLPLDDTIYVTENPFVRPGITAFGMRHALYGSRGGLWMPLSFLSHMVDVEIFGLDPTGPHLENVALHAANTVLLLLLLFRLTGAVAASAAVAALFALHPLRVESVAWIAERKDVLSAFFGLLTVHAWVSYVRAKRFAWYLVVLAGTALALFAKPMLVTLPLLLLLLDLWPLRRLAAGTVPHTTSWELVLEKLPLLALAGATAAMTLTTAHTGSAMPTLAERSLATRAAHAAASYVWYVWKTVWPTDLAILYPYPTWASWQVAGAVVVLVAGAVAAIATCRRAPWIAVGAAWFAIGLFPVIGFFQAGSQGMADRFTYFPHVGLFLAVVWTADALARSPRARMALGASAIAVAGACAVASTRQLGYWHDPVTLYEHTLAVTTSNWMIETEMGNEWLRHQDPARAYAQFEESYRIEPRYNQTSLGLGLAAVALGRPDEAEAHYRDAIRVDPGYAKAHNNLGILLFEQHDTDRALHHLSEAARFDPESPEIIANLRHALTEIGVTDVDDYVSRLDTWTSEAAADRDRPGGVDYGRALMGKLLAERVDAVRSCFARSTTGMPAPFDVYVSIAADGALEDIAALPPTPVARCFGDELRAARAPAPPFAPFHAMMSMQFDG